MFVGGGTPSLLGGDGLAAVLDAVRDHFVLAADAEVTTEANPESTSPRLFADLRAAGFTRISLGMQSVAPQVLAALDRVHSPGRPLAAAREARAEGFDHVNLDLIYGTPGETDDDLRRSVDAAIEAGVDHVSAYALGGRETGPRSPGGCAAERSPRPTTTCWPSATSWSTPRCRMRASTGTRYPTGVVPAGSAGTTSATGRAANGGARVLERTATSAPPDGGTSSTRARMRSRWPTDSCRSATSRSSTPRSAHTEDVMLRLRLRTGLPCACSTTPRGDGPSVAVADGLVEPTAESLVLTDRGRLLADAVVRDLLTD